MPHLAHLPAYGHALCPHCEAEFDLAQAAPTNDAAPAINRSPQTLRKWACLECGPIRPIRINGRLAWRVSDLRTLLSGGA